MSDFPDFEGLVNWDNVQQWMETQPGIPGTGPITFVSKIEGGSQNNLFLIHRGPEKMVLRRPPRHLRKNSNATMVREARLLEGLKDSAVPHARLYGACSDEAVIGACFYVMQPLDGWSPKGPLPGRFATDAGWRRKMSESFVEAGAALAAVDHVAAGLADYGKPDQWHERQVERWRSQLEGYRDYEGYAPDNIASVDAVGRWLNDNLPSDRKIGIMHGDFQYPNVMYRHDRPEVVGLIDWELSTLGDPMIDLGWLLSSWIEEGDPAGRDPVVSPWNGFMTRKELIALYGERTGRDMGEVNWFFALACYKLGCLLEGTYARSLVGQAPKETGDRFHGISSWLFTKAEQLIHQA
jgi:aminoglycoside phosphotransferase (APT) family kinase protein